MKAYVEPEEVTLCTVSSPADNSSGHRRRNVLSRGGKTRGSSQKDDKSANSASPLTIDKGGRSGHAKAKTNHSPPDRDGSLKELQE